MAVTRVMYALIDFLFIVFHTALMFFNAFGWAWRQTRRLHLVTLTLTLFSWFGLGLWFGMGYCPCTDWHWQIRERMGDTGLPNSYLKWFIDRLTGWDVPPIFADRLATGVVSVAMVLSIALNVRDWRRRRVHRDAAMQSAD